MVGNDIVDLSDPESSRGANHSRFDRRVFTPEELEALSIEYSDVQMRWILWSAKEATYKAARRDRAGIVFSPARFVVELDRSLCGSVTVGDHRWPVRVQIGAECVHAVVSGNESFVGTHSNSRRLTLAERGDPSHAVRRFAIASISEALGVTASDLRIEKNGRIPQLIVAREVASVALSLSHHGAYMGFACHDSRFEKSVQIPPPIAHRESGVAAHASSDCGFEMNSVHRSDVLQSVLH
jgi:phosphopantetheinyl transferase (holo-ACP synthase)